MSEFLNNMEMCGLINRFVNLVSKGNIYNLDYEQQEYILDNNINATYLLSFDEWKDKGARIYKGSKSIRLPHYKLVFDVQQTNYVLNSDEDFPNLIFDLDSGVAQRNIHNLIDSFISINKYDEAHMQYENIVYGILLKRFKNTNYIAENNLNYPDLVDLGKLSDITNNVFNFLKSIYNEIKYTSNEDIRLSEILDYAVNNELGGMYYGGYGSEFSDEDEDRFLEGESTLDLSENERQRDTLSTSSRYSGSIPRELGSSRESDDKGLQQESRNEITGSSLGGLLNEDGSVYTESERDSSSRNFIQDDRGIEENTSDQHIAFLNEQLSLFSSIETITNHEIEEDIISGKKDEIEQHIDDVYDESDERLSFETKTHVINENYIDNVINDVDNIPIQNKTFDELDDDERDLVENDDDLYLAVYNNSVDKGYVITDEMKEFMDNHQYGSQDGIDNPDDIKVLGKWFAPVGAGTWIATECDGYDEDGNPYLYGCATLGYGWEWGFLPSFKEMESINLGFGNLRIERDKSVNVGDSLYSVLSRTDKNALLDLGFNQELTSDTDEINNVLKRGSGFAEGKFRIYELFTNKGSLDSKEIANLLKNEYGIGGFSHPRKYNSRFHGEMHDSKGLSIKLYKDMESSEEIEHKLSWNDVANRLDYLVSNDLYLSEDEKNQYNNWLNEADRTSLVDADFSQIAKIEDDDLDDDYQTVEEAYPGVKVEIHNIEYFYSNDWEKAHPLELTNLSTGETEIIDELDSRSSSIINNNNNVEVKYNPVGINYKINDINIGVGSPLERFNNNINAINLLRTLENENRNATTEEQDILAKYVGWGGLADFFDVSKRPDQYKILKETLTDTEYESARESTLSAFYTQPIIIDTIYSALNKFGFKNGNILEPSCGVGNFFGRLPDQMCDSKLYGVELDSISSRIAKKLYPTANIQTSGFENTNFDDNFFDVAIGNVPFGDFSVMDKRYDKYNFKIHDYFFAKTIDKVKNGGVIALITSKGTMDKLNSKAREYIAQRCDLIGAVRLPKEAFKSAGGTETVSDIIFLSKRETPRVNMPSWTKSSDTNFVYIDYFDKYMSREEIENEILSMIENREFNEYNKLSNYCKKKSNEIDSYFYQNNIDLERYGIDINGIEKDISYRSNVFTRDYAIQRWNSTWNNRYSNIKSNSDYSFYGCGGIELYRWFKEDPEEVIRICAFSGKFNSKAKSDDEKLDLAREYLTLSEDGIENNLKKSYVNRVVDFLMEYATSLDNKNGQYMQPINNYFVENKDMIIGTPSITTSRFGYDLDVSLGDDKNLKEELSKCINNLDYTYVDSSPSVDHVKEDKTVVLPANMRIKNYSYDILEGNIYYRINSTMQLIPSDSSNYTLLKDVISLNKTYKDLINAQLNGVSDDDLLIYQDKLNTEYDEFVSKNGRIFSLSKKLKEFINNDSTLSRIQSLEIYDENNLTFTRKADIFTERTIHKQETIIDHVDTSLDALLVSLKSRLSVDLDFMSELTNKSKETIINDLKGIIYRNHLNENEYLSADEYLSGNVKAKLKEVNELIYNTERELRRSEDEDEKLLLEYKINWLNENLNALNEAQPIDLQPFEIDMPLGASWIPTSIIQKFTEDVILEGNFYSWNKPKILRSSVSKNWFIENKTRVYNSSNLTEKYGLNVKGHNALDILESCLNLKREEVAFYVEDENGKKQRIVDKQKTLIAIQKQDLIKKEFSNWIKEHEDIAKELADIYNERFNCIVDRKYNPDLIEPVGLSNLINGKPIELYSHQKEAVAKALFGGNAGIFHSVGAGKTLTLITIAMESKRLGLCNKSLFVVPKAIVGQWGNDFVSAYPNANVLVADEKSFSKENRRKFINKIASGNYDAIIISNEQFKLLKLSDERVVSYIQEDIDRIQEFLSENSYRSGGKSWSVKQAESIKKKLETRIKKRNEMAKDDYINFEELGIDKLFIDESHNFKNLAFETSLGRIKGIGSSADAQKSNDLYYKTRYLNQLTNNKGIVFATGTPISNYLAEMFTIQRYLQPDVLEYMDVSNFDSWVSVFGEIVEEQQLDVTGTKYTPKAVLKRYHNLPELMGAFRQVADIRTKDTLDLDLPDVERINIEIPRTDEQKEYLDELNIRLDRIRNNQVDPTEDNMLLITNDGRKMALDQRLVDKPITEDDIVKADYVVDNVYNEYVNSSSFNGTQAIFSDLSTPSDKWNIYTEIKKGLVAKGIPENEIQFIHDFDTKSEKEKVIKLINEGKVRVILGSTQKLGTGVNIQERLVAIHHIDVPWKPSDIEQREGRIVRQGNSNDNVKIYRYITADTFDAYSWQIIENKATFISQIMTNKNPARTCDDLDDDGLVLDAAQIKAIATGNPLIKERMTLENDIKKLTISKQEYLKGKARLKENITINIPNEISYRKDNISRLENDISMYIKPKTILDDSGKEQYALDITINNNHYTDYKLAGEALHSMSKIVKYPDDKLTLSFKGKVIGKYQNYDIRICAGDNLGDYIFVIGDQWNTIIPKYESPINQIKNILTRLDTLNDTLLQQKESLSNAEKNLQSSKELLNKPFEYEQELIDKQKRLDEIVESMDNVASYSSDDSLDGMTLYDEEGNIINNDYDEDNEYDKGKEL